MFSDTQIEDMWNEFTTLLRSTNRPGMDELINWLERSDLRSAPSSTKFHNCFKGGLLNHLLNVYHAAVRIQDDFKVLACPEKQIDKIPQESIIITTLLHDLCKVNYYKQVRKTWKDEQEPNQYAQWKHYIGYDIQDNFPIVHGNKSVILAMHFIRLTPEEICAISHHMLMSDSAVMMSPYQKGPTLQALNDIPLVLLVALADMTASFMMEKEEDIRISNACQ